jgi:hypothetical protein
MKRSEQRVYRLTGTQWYALKGLAKAFPKHGYVGTAPTQKALHARGLIERNTLGWVLSELGQRVYARLSVGEFCQICDRPLTFERRTLVVGSTKWECNGCSRRAA